MENCSERFQKVEIIVNGMEDKEEAKKLLAALLDDIRQKIAEKTLTKDDCSDAHWAFNHITIENDLSPEDCGCELQALEELMDEFPPLRKAYYVNVVAEQLKKQDKMNRALTAVALASLRKFKMTRKQIKKAVNKYLTVQQRKNFTVLLNELEGAAERYASIANLTDVARSIFDGVESKPISKKDSHKMTVDYLSRKTQELVEENSVPDTVVFQKGHRIMGSHLGSANDDEEQANLITLEELAKAIQPDAIITNQLFWWVPEFGKDEKFPDDYNPSTDPDKRMALMVTVETPTDYWRAVQLYLRNDDGAIVLGELIGPNLQENPKGWFSFLRNTSGESIQ
jgi:hypothetical protein